MAVIFGGVDPGLSGAFAFICDNEIICEVVPVIEYHKGKKVRHHYDIAELKRRLHNILYYYPPEDTLIAVESQHAMPKQGVSSMFSIGRGLGIWEGLLAGMGFPFQLVQPREWQKLLTGLPGNPKDRSVAYVSRKYPQVDLRATDRCKKPHNGKADAITIAEWCELTAGKA